MRFLLALLTVALVAVTAVAAPAPEMMPDLSQYIIADADVFGGCAVPVLRIFLDAKDKLGGDSEALAVYTSPIGSKPFIVLLWLSAAPEDISAEIYIDANRDGVVDRRITSKDAQEDIPKDEFCRLAEQAQ